MLQTHSPVSDENIFAFWPLSNVKRLRDQYPEYPANEFSDNFFVFADYMIRSWDYAIEMTPNAQETGRVILVPGPQPQTISQTFSQFVELYSRGRLRE